MNLDYPKDFAGNIKYRAQIFKSCEVDKQLQADVKEMCKNNILFWIDCFCYTKDPRRKPDELPFICYDFQREHIITIQKAIDNQHDCLTEKSRDMGASWMALYVFMHKWLFEDGSDFRVGSRKEEFVDKPKVIDTLFEKLRFCLERQPDWLMPEGFDWGKHSTYMKLHNPTNGNTIVGESANEDFGSGGRSKAILLDEYSKWDASLATAAWTATADVSKCRLPVSTPKGSSNKFALLAKGTKEKIKVLTLHWTLHPDKAKSAYYLDGDNNKIDAGTPQSAFKLWKSGIRVRSPWYDAEDARRKATDLAQEVDIDYLRSGNPFFDVNAVSKQIKWEYLQRKLPSDPLPLGKFIRIKLVDANHKVETREVLGGWLKVFEMPKPGHQYVLSSDTSEGLPKGDESFGIVREKITRNVVATCNGLYKPEEFSTYLFLIEKFYNNADNAPENNNHGYSVCNDLYNVGSNLYYSRRKRMKDGQVADTITKRGWSTDATSRPYMLDLLEEEIRKGVFEMRDPDLISQAGTFINNERGKPIADGDFLDDGIMALAIGSAVIQERPFRPVPLNRSPHAEKMVKRKNAGFSFAGSAK